MTNLDELLTALNTLTLEQRRDVFTHLRAEIPIHRLEAEWNASAEEILESIAQAGPLTRRMIPGLIAEQAFATRVLSKLPGWASQSLTEEMPYDFLITDAEGSVRVQVKIQRSEGGKPLEASPRNRSGLVPGMFVVETDKSREGTDAEGNSTRGYQFDSFDILAVSLFPSTRDWSRFLYTVEDWLVPRPDDASWMYKYQGIPREPNTDWTDDLEIAVKWFREQTKKKIAHRPIPIPKPRQKKVPVQINFTDPTIPE